MQHPQQTPQSSSSSSAFHCRLFPKILRKWAPQATRTHRGTTKRRHSDSTLVNPQQLTGKNEKRDFEAAFVTLASTYGWGAPIPAPLPSEPTQSRKIARKRPAHPKETPTPPPPSPPSQQTFTQAQREQAVVDVMSRYSWASPLPGGRSRY
ncbi:hypothetical protein BGW80DRAFT_411723 [Lactifluus volemus]|nr:hypothetical protein BGW80DRAFT_411723 [Lactifluus volemus]